MSIPSVLFVCVKNGGKSQMAAGLLRKIADDSIEIHSAGTAPGHSVNPLSAQSLLEVGIDVTRQHPTPIDPQLLVRMDYVVIIGSEAVVDKVNGPTYERWGTDEPSDRGIDGIERMRLIRDDITDRVTALAARLSIDRPRDL